MKPARIIPVLALCLLSLAAFGDEESGVDTLEFSHSSKGGKAEAAASAASDKRVRNCYVALGISSGEGRGGHRVLKDRAGNRSAREKSWRVALSSSYRGERGIYILGRDRPPLFAPYPEEALRRLAGGGKVLLELRQGDFVTRSPFVLLFPDRISGFMDKMGTIKAGGSPTKAHLLIAAPAQHTSALTDQLMENIRAMAPETHRSYSDSARGGGGGGGNGSELKEAFLSALQACREVSEPKLRQLVDEETVKFTQR